jgi:hypothetical protein
MLPHQLRNTRRYLRPCRHRQLNRIRIISIVDEPAVVQKQTWLNSSEANAMLRYTCQTAGFLRYDYPYHRSVFPVSVDTRARPL